MTKIEELWQSIRQESTAGLSDDNGWKFLRLDPQHPFDIYAAVDVKGLAVLAIGTSAPPPLIDGDTGALGYIRFQRSGGRWLMGLRLAAAGLEGVFGRLCQDLADAAADVSTEAALVALFRERLTLWKRLFRDGGSGLMQKFQIKGLVGELLTLEEFILARTEDPLQAVMAWVGPGGADQDFLFSDHAVEVKSVHAGASSVSISSAGQLDCIVPLELRTCVIREAAPEEPAALTLPLLVARIEQLLAAVPGAARLFRYKMLEAGYVEQEYYRTIAFSLLEKRLYSVVPAFPRIVPAFLPAGIPDVSYSILFAAIEGFRVSETKHAA